MKRDDVPILVVQIKSGGVGIDGWQRVCNDIVFIEVDWTPGTGDQNLGRLLRIGQIGVFVRVAYMVLKNSFDEKVIGSYTGKKNGSLTGFTEQDWLQKLFSSRNPN